MPKYNIHWTDMHNVEIDADNETDAIQKWMDGDYDEHEITTDILDEAEPEELVE